MKPKQMLIVFLVIWTILAAVPAVDAAAPPVSSYISINVYGKPLVTDVSAVLVNGRVMAPYRAIFESLGANVKWDYDVNMAVATRNNKEITLLINSPVAWVDKQKVQLDAAPVIISERMMVPVRFISETLGEPIRWDETTRTVYIGVEKLPEDTSWTKEITLSKDSSLAYSPDHYAAFTGGTRLSMRSKEFVGSGTLKNDSFLPVSKRGGTEVLFKGGTIVTFNEQGYACKGTTGKESVVEYASADSVSVDLLPYKDRNRILLKKDTQFEMDKDGYLTKGILATDTNFTYSDKGIVSMKGDTEVAILPGGNVSKGTLSDTIMLPIDQKQKATFKFGTAIQFLNGKVIQGTLYEDAELAYQDGYGTQKAVFKGYTPVELNERGYVKQGVLAEDSSLCYQAGKFALFEKDTSVEFYDNGFVRQGYLKTSATLKVSSASSKNFAAHTLIAFGVDGFVLQTAPSN